MRNALAVSLLLCCGLAAQNPYVRSNARIATASDLRARNVGDLLTVTIQEQHQVKNDDKVERKQDVFGPFVPLSRSPQLMIEAAKMGTYLRFGNSLPRALSEFAIILQSRRWSQQYEWNIHAADAKTAGLPDAVIQAVAEIGRAHV